MILGFEIQPLAIEIGGVALFIIFGVALVLGMRGVHVPGLSARQKTRVHKIIGVTAVVLAVVHGLMAFAYLNGWTVG